MTIRSSTVDGVDTVILPPVRDLGDGFTVRRALPSPQRRMVGPFIFFDQMGPVAFGPGEGLDVRPHPHIGLATVTYLIDGEIMHRDSVGSVQAIRPGEVNWMTAAAASSTASAPGPKSARPVRACSACRRGSRCRRLTRKPPPPSRITRRTRCPRPRRTALR